MDTKTSQNGNNFNCCRCCLTNEGSSDISEECSALSDRKRAYETILLETFGIKINHHSYTGRKICAICISRLQDAAAFKHQVLDTELRLIQMFKEFANSKNPVKGETECNEGASKHICDNMHHVKQEFDDGMYNDFGDEMEVQLKPSTDETVPSNVTNSTGNRRNIGKKYHKKICADTDESRSVIGLRDTSLKLFLNSNMCLFKSKRTKFACNFCPQSYFDMKQLREHSQEHYENGRPKINFNKCQGLTYKNVDISGLKCLKCSNDCDDLNSLMEHLDSLHGIGFKNSEHMLVPFRLEEGLSCVLCHARFQTFARLTMHMHTHSTRNVCEICGVAYINRISLRNHIYHIHKMHKCRICAAEFPTVTAKSVHMRKVHNAGISKRYCLKCDETFRYAHMLKKHMIEAHGAAKEAVECEHCPKIFPSAYALKIHTRSVHIGERNHPCSLCDKRFFTSNDKRRHEDTHGGDNKCFSCCICTVKFRTKDSLRRHLRKQHSVSRGNT